jgi:Mg-chelatase subunit ChlD
MDAGVADGGECDDFTIVLKPSQQTVVSMMLVVDRSRSMLVGDRWGRMKEALVEVTSSLQESVRFGIILFPDPLSGQDCTTGSVLTDPEMMTAAQIQAALDFWEPNGGTPTALTLNAAGDALRRVNPGGENWVLLATDGGPGCNLGLGPGCRCIPDASCDGQPGNCLDDERTLQAVRALRARGIKTLVIGIPGTEGVSDLLDQMAVEGGTDAEGRHQAVDDLNLLLATLRASVGAVVPCTFTYAEAPEDLSRVRLSIDGEIVPRDPTHVDGWDVETGLLTLYGTACERIRDGVIHTIEALVCE